jgi:prepilin-type N-terminal cleavage/methylation domain-containing protein
MRHREERGFTLIEVLAALLIVSLVFGLLIESVTRNLADLGRSRLEARAAELAQQRAADLVAELNAGAPIEDGELEGAYEPPDDDLRWRQKVSALSLPLPDDYPGELPPSPLFALAGRPAAPLAPGQQPTLRLVEVRVFPADEAEPETVDPTIFFVVAPPDAARLQELQSQAAQNPQQADREAAEPPQPEPD